MSEISAFENGEILERNYYSELSPEAERKAGLEATDAIDDLFKTAYGVESAVKAMSFNGELSIREIRASFTESEEEEEGALWGDAESGAVFYYNPKPYAANRKVVVRHHRYQKDDFKNEEYFVSVERKIPTLDDPIYVLYEIEFFKNGMVNTNVRTQRIDIEGTGQGNELEQRSMKQYDIDELNKEISEIKNFFETGTSKKNAHYLFNDVE